MTRAQLPPAGADDTLYVIDLSGYIFRAYHAVVPLSNSKGEPTHAVMGTVNMLNKVVTDRKPALLAIAMDSGKPTFRHLLDARYKATRPPAPPDLSQQIRRCEEIVLGYNIPCYRQEGVEADDLVASLTRLALAAGLRVVVVSADKDLMQLVRDEDHRVLLWDSMRDRVFGPDEVTEKFGVRASQVRDFLALTGDSSDNIPGVPSVGPKTASELLTQFGTVDGIYQSLDTIKRPKLRDALAANEGDARISQKLVTLKSDDALDFDLEHLRYGGANVKELTRLFTELEFTRLLTTLDKLSASPLVTPQVAPAAMPRAVDSAPATYSILSTQSDLEAFLGSADGTFALEPLFDRHDALRAELVGFGVAMNPHQVGYIPLAHRVLGGPPMLAASALATSLKGVVNVVRIATSDAKRLELALARIGVPLPSRVSDVRIAGYLLQPEADSSLPAVAKRELGIELPAVADTKGKNATPIDQLPVSAVGESLGKHAGACIALVKKLDDDLKREKLTSLYEEVEMPLTHVLSTMERRGVLVDTVFLAELGKRVDGELRALDAKAKAIVGHEFSMRSRDQLEGILFDELALRVVKKTPKGGRSTDAEVLEQLADEHELPNVILQHRELDKLKGTYIDALPRSVNPDTGRVHTSFAQAVAATGRLSSIDPNLQNIPIRTEVGREIRGAFIAPPGKLILSADYSQIELRIVAHLASDPALIEAFNTGGDIHTLTAAQMLHVAPDAVTTDMRRAAKAINFGVIYGMGEFALGKQLGIPRSEAKQFITAYFARYSKVAQFLEQAVESAKSGEAMRTLLGRKRPLPNMASPNRILRTEAERIAKNTPVQGTAADILKLAMVKMGASPLAGCEMVLTVHDELVFEVDESIAEEAAAYVKKAMQGVMSLSVPLTVDAGWGKNWREAHG